LDAKKRRQDSLLLPGLTFVLGTLVLPIYIAKRNLKEGEVREGGLGWNILKNFALYWTITWAVCCVLVLFSGDEAVATFGIMTFGFIWFVGAVSALVLGMFLKKNSIIEKGPTGALAKLGEADYKLSNLAQDVSGAAHKGMDKAKEMKAEGKLDPNKIANEISSVAHQTVNKTRELKEGLSKKPSS
jgi:hypothetical protein